MRITLSRVVMSDGGYVSTSIDQLINKDENVTHDGIQTEAISTDSRKQELYIDLIQKVSDISVSFRTSGEIIFKDNTVLELDDDFSWDGEYYVYGYGIFQGSRANLTPAIVLANETYGTVIDSKAGVVWKRYRNSQASVDGVTPVITGNSLINSVQMLCNYL